MYFWQKYVKILIMLKKIIITTAAIFLALGSVVYFNRVEIRDFLGNAGKKSLPPAVSYNETAKIGLANGNAEAVEVLGVEADLKLPEKNSAVSDERPAVSVPGEYNLAVPFAPQAPFANWDAVHEDACEEASAIMAASFVLKKEIPDMPFMDRQILDIVAWEDKNFGFSKDTDAAKTAEILQRYYGLKNVEAKYDISLDDIKKEVAAGRPVIIPAAGRELHNPYFRAPGPLYHMVVVKGYTKDAIITNDPGTKRGADFVYDNDIFYDAIHDWNNGDVLNGRKAMIIVKE